MSEKNTAVIRLLAGKMQDEGADKDAAVLARYYSDNGADELLVFDLSDTDADHDLSIGALKEICRAVEVPVKAGGRIKRLEDVNRLIDKLYEDSISGKVNETNFVRLLGKYQQEQESILAEKEKLQDETAAVREIRSDAEHFADLLEQYGDISELTPEILNMLVEKIVVYEPRAVDGVMRQQLNVYYRYIGVIKLVDYGSTTYYKHGEVTNAAKKREKVKMEKRIAAVKEEVQNDEPVSA